MPRLDEDITQQKYADLMAAYRRIAPTCATQQQAWERVCNSPAPRFYVTHYQAYQRMLQMFRNDRKIKDISIWRRRLYEALYDVVVRLSQKKEYMGMSLYQLTQFAVKEPAPSFFISPTSIPKIFRNIRKTEMAKNQKFATFYKQTYIDKNKDKEK